MVSEPDTEQCVSENAGPRREMDCEILYRLEKGTSVNEDIGSRLEEGWIVRSRIYWRGERNILYKGVKTSPSRRVLKP